MKRSIVFALCLGLLAWLASFTRGADRDWQKLVVPTADEAAGKFASPPPEYGITRKGSVLVIGKGSVLVVNSS
jgi:hypothetical protein